MRTDDQVVVLVGNHQLEKIHMSKTGGRQVARHLPEKPERSGKVKVKNVFEKKTTLNQDF
jgi:hypothetical protein